jgi:diguanylate cyclase (GGDEF)-like protein
MAAVDFIRHTAALRAILGVDPGPERDDPAPGYDGPAVWIGPAAPEPLGNPLSADLRGLDGEYAPSIAALASDVVAARGPRAVSVSIESSCGALRHFDLTGVPQGGGVLILARETTADVERRRTTLASRDMFRDIALCAGGFAFEVDGLGLLRWLGPGKTLGYGPETLIGRPARELLLLQSPDAFDPFGAHEPVFDAPIWVQSLDQGPRALRVTVRPIYDASGVWRGVRGHARDETNDIRHARRDRFCQDIIQAMRSAHSPAALIRAIASATAEACGIETAWVFPAAPEEGLELAQQDLPCDMLRQVAARAIHEGIQFPSLFSANDRTGLATALRAQDRSQGALLIAGPPGCESPSRDSLEVLRLITPMAAVALAHARLTVRLVSQASQDTMTGLLNQAGWNQALDAKLLVRRLGAVVMVECDRFRAFGDGLGQAASDELLIEIANRLRGLCAPGDVCARLGEASFAIWLDGADSDSAAKRAEDVAEAFRVASRRMSLALALSPLIGISLSTPSNPLSAEEAMSRATQSIAASKRKARGRGAGH